MKGFPSDPDQRTRQQVYLRALRTLKKIRIHFGHFTSHPVKLPLADSTPGGPKFAKVIKSEEKGSDVNLAAHLVNDAHLGLFESAVVVTNDSDLVEPVRIVTKQIGLPVGVLNPCGQPAGGLKNAATFYRVLRKGVLKKTQFPRLLEDKQGTFSKPRTW